MTQGINHADRDHALLSPSSAQKWLFCPASARLEDSLPDNTSEYAEEGRLAHELCEVYLRLKLGNAPPDVAAKKAEIEKDPRCDAEMKRCAEAYVDFVTETAYAQPAMPYIATEQRVDISNYAPESFGTVDCLILAGTELYVIDFKYGRGVSVYAEANSQLMLYALGALDRYAVAFAIDTVRLVIVQPRAGGISNWEVSANELRDWGEIIVKPAAQKAFAEGGEFVPGPWCSKGFCRAAGSCKARAAYMLGVIEDNKDKDAALLTAEEIGPILTAAQDFAPWLKKVESLALEKLLAGENVPDWKAVEGRSNRRIEDEKKAVRLLKAAGFKQAALYTRSFLGFGELEKLVGKQELVDILGDTIQKPQGKPTLAPESDRRKPYQSEQLDAAEVFQEKGEKK